MLKMFESIVDSAWHVRRTREFRLVTTGCLGIEHFSVVKAMRNLRTFELHSYRDSSQQFCLPSSVREVATNAPNMLRWAEEDGAGLDMLVIKVDSRSSQGPQIRYYYSAGHGLWWNVKGFRMLADPPACKRDSSGRFDDGWGDSVVKKFCEALRELTLWSGSLLETIEFEAYGAISRAAVDMVNTCHWVSFAFG